MSETDARIVVLEGTARQARGARPSTAWRRRWLGAVGFLAPEEVRAWCRLQWEQALAGSPDELLAIAALWGVAPVAAPGTAAQLADLTRRFARAGRVKLAGAAIEGLAGIAGEPSAEHPGVAREALVQLERLATTLGHRALERRAARAIAAIAEASGLDPEALADTAAEDAGLGPAGTRRWHAGAHELYLFLSEAGQPELVVLDRASGRALGAPPRAVREQHFGALQEARAVKKALADSLTVQQKRLETALATQRAWGLAAWRDVFEAHPLMRHLAERLIWMVGEAAAMPGDGGWRDADDRPLSPAPEAEIRLWHPALASAEAVTTWRTRVVATKRVQPFAQAFREAFRVAPDERAHVYTERLAGRVAGHRALYGALHGRGWTGGTGYGALAQVLKRELPGAGVLAMVGFTPTGQGDGVKLRQVEFYPLPTPEWTPGVEPRLPLGQVPPAAYAEVLRDLALATAFAAAPGDVAFAPLAEARAALVRALLPALGLDGAVRLEGDEAVVESAGQAFRVHLVSGDVRLPNGRRLEIEKLARRELPLYVPHQGLDPRTREALGAVLWLAGGA